MSFAVLGKGQLAIERISPMAFSLNYGVHEKRPIMDI